MLKGNSLEEQIKRKLALSAQNKQLNDTGIATGKFLYFTHLRNHRGKIFGEIIALWRSGQDHS